ATVRRSRDADTRELHEDQRSFCNLQEGSGSPYVVRCGRWRPRDSDHVFQVRAVAMANSTTSARRAKAWAGACVGDVSSTPCLPRRGAATTKKPSPHGRFRFCETPEGKLPASDPLLQERLSSSTGKLSKPAFYVTER